MANQIDHKNYPKRLRCMSVAELRWNLKDARAALTAMPDNPKAGYYADEISYIVMELKRREDGDQFVTVHESQFKVRGRNGR
jgi:hypothetical protein